MTYLQCVSLWLLGTPWTVLYASIAEFLSIFLLHQVKVSLQKPLLESVIACSSSNEFTAFAKYTLNL